MVFHSGSDSKTRDQHFSCLEKGDTRCLQSNVTCLSSLFQAQMLKTADMYQDIMLLKVDVKC
jgi:hypothetical protein